MNIIIFGVIASFVVLTDFFIVASIYSKKSHNDNYLGTTLLLAGFVVITYFISAVVHNYFIMKLFASFYFSGISIMLMYLYLYITTYTGFYKKLVKNRAIPLILWLVVTIDIIIQLINPFWEISIHFTYRPDSIAIWKYEPKFLYNVHLAICYFIIFLIFYHLVYKTTKTPRVYRRKYLGVLFGILLVVAMNGIFLILQDENVLDFSTLFYSLIGFFMTWNRYAYSRHGMLTRVRQMILNELDQPVILFDRDNELSLYNERAQKFVKNNKKSGPLTIYDLIDNLGFTKGLEYIQDNIHFQWTDTLDEKHSIYRVDVKRLRDKRNHHTIGKLIVMTDTTLEMDLLTGFHSKNTFQGFFKHEYNEKKYPVGIAICDINKLSQINRSMGMEIGDKAILTLASLMKKHFPINTYFVRLEDANLAAICPKKTSENIRSVLDNIRDELKNIEGFSQPLEMQSAIAMATLENPNILEATETAMFSVRSKKLMDGNSSHSSLLDSLAQTLLESDNTTRDHVARTKDMGELLGKKLHFSDIQLSNLALLCLLHDIGKLGIPLEILNKPGKLNHAEWEVMKSHVEKGYRIAKASSELENIADLILHHHESWNGKGYPDGLKQEAIPLLSRVIAVIDTYDAMTNDRPYHKAVSDAEAREELRRCAGIQFDPSIVSAFLELLEELHPLGPEKQKIVEKEDAGSTPRGVKEIFATPVQSENIQPIHYSKYILNKDYEIINIDASFAEITGYTQDDLKTYHLRQRDLIPAEDRETYISMTGNIFDSENTNSNYFEHKLLRKDGSTLDIVCLGRPFFDSVSHEPKIEVIIFDVAQTNAFGMMQKFERDIAKRNSERWEKLMRQDSLTGLLNHESFINDVEVELLKDDQKVVLMILDVDYFKNYNDSYGHYDGDKLLTLVAIMLETAVKEYGIAGRLGGDEFAGILKFPVDTSHEKIEAVVKQCFELIINATSSQEKCATVSMGAAYLEKPAGFNKLYQEADHALYRAKENGRKCYSF